MTLKVLADPRFTITTYSKLRATVTKSMPTFRNICRQVASFISIDMFNFVHATDPTLPLILPPSIPKATIAEQENTHEKFAYRKVECFVNSKTLTEKRLDKSRMHPCVAAQDTGARPRCILCCSHCTFGDGNLHARLTVHKRQGFTQRFQCQACEVALCKKPRFLWMGKQETCFKLFHSVSKEELAVLSQNLCTVPNPAESAFGSMVVLAPEKVARQAQTALTMQRVWKDRKTCALDGCELNSVYNMPVLQPKFCAQHKLPDMVHTLDKTPTQKRAYYREPCAFENCGTYASFNYEGNRARFCKQHKLEGMSRVKRIDSNRTEEVSKKRGPYKKKQRHSTKPSTPDVTRCSMIKSKSVSTVEIAVSSPSLKKIGKTATRSVKSRGDVKSLKIIGKAVGARNAYTGKKYLSRALNEVLFWDVKQMKLVYSNQTVQAPQQLVESVA